MNVHQQEPNSHEYEELYEGPILHAITSVPRIDHCLQASCRDCVELRGQHRRRLSPGWCLCWANSKGERPGELPVQQSTKFELAINLTKLLGLDLPFYLQQLVDEVIE